MFIDTHCHLDAAEFDADREAVRQAALDAGVDTLVVPAVAATNFPAVQDCCRRHPGCRAGGDPRAGAAGARSGRAG